MVDKCYLALSTIFMCFIVGFGYFALYLPLKAATDYYDEVDRYAMAQLESGGLTVLTANMDIPHSIAGTNNIVTFLQWAKNLNQTTVYKIGGNNLYYLFETQHINGEDFKVCYWYQAH